MTKYWTPPTFFTHNFFYQNDSEWPKMDFKHNFKKREILVKNFTDFFLFVFEGFPYVIFHFKKTGSFCIKLDSRNF